MARVTIAVVVGLSLMLLTACGDLGSDPSTIAARNRIRDAQAERIKAGAAIKREEAEQRLALQRETHEVDLAVRTVTLSVLLALAVSTFVVIIGTRLYRFWVAERIKLLEAGARAKAAEARALEAQIRLLADLRDGTVPVAPSHDDRNGTRSPGALLRVLDK